MENPHKGILNKRRRDLKTLKDYTLVKGELYRKMPGGILSRCVGQEKVQRNLKEVHDRTYGFCEEIRLYRRLQRAGFYWPSMGQDADLVKPNVRPAILQ